MQSLEQQDGEATCRLERHDSGNGGKRSSCILDELETIEYLRQQRVAYSKGQNMVPEKVRK